MAVFESPFTSIVQEQLVAVQAEAMNLRRANEGLANKLVQVTHLRDELASWARDGATMA